MESGAEAEPDVRAGAQRRGEGLSPCGGLWGVSGAFQGGKQQGILLPVLLGGAERVDPEVAGNDSGGGSGTADPEEGSEGDR